MGKEWACAQLHLCQEVVLVFATVLDPFFENWNTALPLLICRKSSLVENICNKLMTKFGMEMSTQTWISIFMSISYTQRIPSYHTLTLVIDNYLFFYHSFPWNIAQNKKEHRRPPLIIQSTEREVYVQIHKLKPLLGLTQKSVFKNYYFRHNVSICWKQEHRWSEAVNSDWVVSLQSTRSREEDSRIQWWLRRVKAVKNEAKIKCRDS